MSLYSVDSSTGDIDLLAGSTKYADNPIGTILPYGGTTAPSGWFLCQGQAISRTNYADLFAVIGTAFGSGDGSTTFNIPDLRGEFLRGAGTNSHADQGDGGTVGEHQDGTLNKYIEGVSGDQIRVPVTNTSNFDKLIASTERIVYSNGAIAQTSNGKYGTVRPTNTSVNYIIKAKHVSAPQDFIDAITEANEYSASEIVVGKWIDGKPIYRLVVTGLSFGATTKSWANTGYTLNDCDSFISGHAIRTSQKTVSNEMSFKVNNNNLQYYTDSGWSDCDSVVMEYTKTTD